jgi:putative glycosyltransferase (TIGR04372 family)
MRILYLLANWNRIGHMFMEPMVYSHIHEEDDITFLVPEVAPANSAAAAIVTRNFKIVPVPNFYEFFQMCETGPVQMGEYQLDVWRNTYIGQYCRRQRDATRQIRYYTFSRDEIRTGLQIERELGINHDQPIVCLHSRESGYLPHLSYHSYRDASIINFNEAIDFLIESGFSVVRIGDTSMTPLTPRQGLHDIAVIPDKHPLCDIWFCVRSRFMIGTTSGPLNIPMYFNDPPLLVVNVIPAIQTLCKHMSRFMPKLLYSKKLGRNLSMREARIANFDFTTAKMYEDREIEVIENSSEDILDAVREMVFDLNGDAGHLLQHPLQVKYSSSIQSVIDFKTITNQECFLIPENRVATSFLVKNSYYVE